MCIFQQVKLLSATTIVAIMQRVALHDWIVGEINCASVINQCWVVAGVFLEVHLFKRQS